MPHYKTIVIANPGLRARQIIDLFKRAGREVTSRGGVIRGIDHMGVRPLAYRMRSHLRYYHWGRFLQLRCDASPAAIKRVQERLKTEEDVVRFLVTKEKRAPLRPLAAPALTGRGTPADAGAYGFGPNREKSANRTAATLSFLSRKSPLDYLAAQHLLAQGIVSPLDDRAEGALDRVGDVLKEKLASASDEATAAAEEAAEKPAGEKRAAGVVDGGLGDFAVDEDEDAEVSRLEALLRLRNQGRASRLSPEERMQYWLYEDGKSPKTKAEREAAAKQAAAVRDATMQVVREQAAQTKEEKEAIAKERAAKIAAARAKAKEEVEEFEVEMGRKV